MDKSVLFWTKKDSEYNYGACFRDKNPTNLNDNKFRINEDFETEEKKSHWDNIYTWKEILITGERVFTDYIGRRLKEVFELSSYEGVAVCSWGGNL